MHFGKLLNTQHHGAVTCLHMFPRLSQVSSSFAVLMLTMISPYAIFGFVVIHTAVHYAQSLLT